MGEKSTSTHCTKTSLSNIIISNDYDAVTVPFVIAIFLLLIFLTIHYYYHFSLHYIMTPLPVVQYAASTAADVIIVYVCCFGLS